MKRFLTITIVFAVLGAGAFFLTGCGSPGIAGVIGAANPPEPTEVAAVLPITESRDISVTGRLVPADQMEVSFLTGGTIREVLVTEGQAVKKGEVIARLRGAADMELAVSQASLEVLNAEKAIQDLKISAPLLAAQINYDITQEQDKLEDAQDKREAMKYPKATQENIDNAYKDYLAAKDVFEWVESFANSESKSERDQYNEARKLRDMAWNKYAYLIANYTDVEISEADAVVALHQTKLDDLKRQYAIYSKGPDSQELKIAEARLELAKDTLAAAEAKFADLELRAPFTGTIVSVGLKEGQLANPGQPVALLADFSRWNVETEDLTELTVTRIALGAQTAIEFDALPDQAFTGTVKQIKDIGVTKQGDITYTVVIELAESDPLFRWNMTAPVRISEQ